MNRSILLNQLKLAYSPLCNYDFNILKTDPVVQNILRESSIYIIAQRPTLSFENIFTNEEEQVLYFEIRQAGNANVLKCKLPFFQDNLATNKEEFIYLYMGSNDPNNKFIQAPYGNIHGMKIIQGREFIVWFSPEKFMFNFMKGYFHAEIEGDIRDFTNYKVHYVGKATDQDIWKRLTGHATLQEILSLEYPLNYGSLPTHEIVILFMALHENLSINSFNSDSDTNEMVDTFLGRNLPDQRTIFLDAEKALIKAMQPKYNKEIYKSYPKSKDGLYNYKFDHYSYTLVDNLTLKYDQGSIVGKNSLYGGDAIVIEDNVMKVIKR